MVRVIIRVRVRPPEARREGGSDSAQKRCELATIYYCYRVPTYLCLRKVMILIKEWEAKVAA